MDLFLNSLWLHFLWGFTQKRSNSSKNSIKNSCHLQVFALNSVMFFLIDYLYKIFSLSLRPNITCHFHCKWTGHMTPRVRPVVFMTFCYIPLHRYNSGESQNLEAVVELFFSVEVFPRPVSYYDKKVSLSSRSNWKNKADELPWVTGAESRCRTLMWCRRLIDKYQFHEK